jgi:hypothetical protein
VGLKDWLAKNVAGASSYGEVMGRECVKDGIVLGRTLYLGHGTRATPSDRYLFEDAEEMQSNGFELYCKDPLSRPAMEDASELSRQTRAAGIAFATRSTLAAASNFMRNEANYRDFTRSVGAESRAALAQLNSGVTIEQVVRFFNLAEAERVFKSLTLEKPGTNDLLGLYLAELSKKLIVAVSAFKEQVFWGSMWSQFHLCRRPCKRFARLVRTFIGELRGCEVPHAG